MTREGSRHQDREEKEEEAGTTPHQQTTTPYTRVQEERGSGTGPTGFALRPRPAITRSPTTSHDQTPTTRVCVNRLYYFKREPRRLYTSQFTNTSAPSNISTVNLSENCSHCTGIVV